MKILYAGNVANVGYTTAKYIRKLEVSAELLMRKNTPRINDPIKVDPSLNGKYPLWIHFFEVNKPGWKRRVLKVLRDKKYDLIQGQSDLLIFAYLSRRPYVAQPVGTELRETAFTNSLRGILLRRAFKKAKLIFFTGPNDVNLLKKLKINTGIFVPIIWDTNFFKPESLPHNEFSDKFVIFHPANLDWKTKGNDILLKGYSYFVNKNPNSILIIVDRGPDSDKTRELVISLRIEKNVKFVKGPLISNELKKYYNLSDVVTDQFILQGLGGIACETFCCEKPLLTNCPDDIYKNLHDENPPTIHAQTASEICKKLELLTDEKIRHKIGKKSREWVLNYHSPEVVTQKMKKIYEMILEGKKGKEICEEFNLS